MSRCAELLALGKSFKINCSKLLGVLFSAHSVSDWSWLFMIVFFIWISLIIPEVSSTRYVPFSFPPRVFNLQNLPGFLDSCWIVSSFRSVAALWKRYVTSITHFKEVAAHSHEQPTHKKRWSLWTYGVHRFPEKSSINAKNVGRAERFVNETTWAGFHDTSCGQND